MITLMLAVLGMAVFASLLERHATPQLLAQAQAFFRDESCGQCVPCRVGTKRLLEILDRICKGQGKEEDIEKLETLSGGITGGGGLVKEGAGQLTLGGVNSFSGPTASLSASSRRRTRMRRRVRSPSATPA